MSHVFPGSIWGSTTLFFSKRGWENHKFWMGCCYSTHRPKFGARLTRAVEITKVIMASVAKSQLKSVCTRRTIAVSFGGFWTGTKCCPPNPVINLFTHLCTETCNFSVPNTRQKHYNSLLMHLRWVWFLLQWIVCLHLCNIERVNKSRKQSETWENSSWNGNHKRMPPQMETSMLSSWSYRQH